MRLDHTIPRTVQFQYGELWGCLLAGLGIALFVLAFVRLDFPAALMHYGVVGKRVQIMLAAVLVVLAGVIMWLCLSEREPVYHGKPLSFWLREYARPAFRTDGRNTEGEELTQKHIRAEVAVKTIGTNAIPTLLKMLGKKDSFFVSPLLVFWNRHRYSFPFWLRYPTWYRNQAGFLHDEAERGFEILGADAQQAVPALIRLYEQNISLHSRAATIRALNAIGPAAQRVATPSFLRSATSANNTEREVAVLALYGVDTEQRQVVPALINALSDTNFVIRLYAARGLGRFGTNARPALPALIRLLNDPNLRVRPDATNALRKIDPEAAAKAGVK